MKDTCIIIPVFNEKTNIYTLLKNTEYLVNKFKWLSFLIVDNASTDGTPDILKMELSNNELTNLNAKIKTIRVPVNKGYGAGIKYGIRNAAHEFIGWMHADDQISTESIDSFLDWYQGLSSGYRIVKGARVNIPLVDRFFTLSLRIIASALLGIKIVDTNGQPTILPLPYASEMLNAPDDYKFDLYVFVLAKRFDIPVIQYTVFSQSRLSGTSSWNTGMLARLRLSIDYLKYILLLLKQRSKGKL